MTTTTTATRTNRTNRRPAPRVEELALSPADHNVEPAAEEPAAAEPAALDPAIAERIRKEEEKLAKEEKAAAARRARIEAYKTGKPIPPAGSKGLPPVVKMNELSALARQLHRAVEMLSSEEVFALTDALGQDGVDGRTAMVTVARLRDEAMRRWEAQLDQRLAANAADNDTLHSLGLVRDEDGKVRLLEKPKSK